MNERQGSRLPDVEAAELAAWVPDDDLPDSAKLSYLRYVERHGLEDDTSDRMRRELSAEILERAFNKLVAGLHEARRHRDGHVITFALLVLVEPVAWWFGGVMAAALVAPFCLIRAAKAWSSQRRVKEMSRSTDDALKQILFGLNFDVEWTMSKTPTLPNRAHLVERRKA